MLADGTCELEEGEVLHPVVVVYHLGSVRLVRVEVKELCHLCLDALLIVIESLCIEEVTLL